VLSAFSAISKFVPNLAIPFVSIITGSISLVANVFEVGQGIVEYRSQKAKLESLRKELDQETDRSKQKEMAEQISKLENQLKVSVIRIAKGMLNVVLSVASIVLGVLVTVSVLTQPVFLLAGSILTAVSLTSVLVLGVSGLVVRKMNNVGRAGNAPSAVSEGESTEENFTDATKETESEDESSEHRPLLNQEIDDSENRNLRSGHRNVGASGKQSHQWGAEVTEYV
jgi:hypothetical protein